ncbi:MAG: glycosyltransferase family 61 protein [Chlamydiota bacterium]
MKKIFLFTLSFTHCFGSTLSTPAKTVSLRDLKEISYTKCQDRTQLLLPKFPLASSEDSSWENPMIPETFIVSIPKGQIHSNDIVLVDNCLVKELLWRWSSLKTNFLDLNHLSKPEHVEGKVAVISQEGHSNYYHWMVEVLPKLALLEQQHISYDWLYVPTNLPFMRQTLHLLGVSQEKILATSPDAHIEADLIVPSAPSLSCYTPKWIVDYLREKLIPQSKQISSKQSFSKKIFISRQKASYRRILNEDEVFDLFKVEGFVRYNLEDLTVLEQISLFHQADIIVAPHGAGLVNLLFAQPCVLIIELFQEHEDDTFWYLSQVMGLKHHCVQTTAFKKGGGYTDTIIPLSLIEDVIDRFIR